MERQHDKDCVVPQEMQSPAEKVRWARLWQWSYSIWLWKGEEDALQARTEADTESLHAAKLQDGPVLLERDFLCGGTSLMLEWAHIPPLSLPKTSRFPNTS